MKTVAFDLDGVLVDFSDGFRRVAGIRDHYEPRMWNWSDVDGMSPEKWSQVWEKIKGTRNFWQGLGRLEGAEQLLSSLYKGEFLNTRLMFITSRPEVEGDSTYQQSRRWIETYLGLINPEVFVCRNVWEKVKAVEEEEVDFVLDDFGPFCEVARHVCKGTYLLRQRWNREDEESYGMPAVWSVNEFLGKVMKNGS